MEQITVFQQGESYVPLWHTRFFWWLATADEALIKDCKTDRSRVTIIGISVLATCLFAALAWVYFFSTVTSSLLASIILGIFMGLMILCIDRALIKGMGQQQKRKWLAVLFRLILAGAIGTFIAQPALLFLFSKEIKAQVSIDNEVRKKDKLQQQQLAFAPQVNLWQQQKDKLQQQLQKSYTEVAAARKSFIEETDGTGGSKKVGMKSIALAKKQTYEQLQMAYERDLAIATPLINTALTNLQNIQLNIAKEQEQFNTLLNDGFATQIAALQNLVKQNNAVAFRYYLLLIILLLIELLPVITKLILPTKNYDEKINLMAAMEQRLFQNKIILDESLQDLYNKKQYERDVKILENDFVQQTIATPSENNSKPFSAEESAWSTVPKEKDLIAAL